MKKEDALNEIGEIIDTLENLQAAMTLPMPAEVHLSALKDGFPDIRDRLKKAYFGLGGDDVWADG